MNGLIIQARGISWNMRNNKDGDEYFLKLWGVT